MARSDIYEKIAQVVDKQVLSWQREREELIAQIRLIKTQQEERQKKVDDLEAMLAEAGQVSTSAKAVISEVRSGAERTTEFLSIESVKTP